MQRSAFRVAALASLLVLAPLSMVSAASSSSDALAATDVSLFQGRPDAGGRLLADVSGTEMVDGAAAAALAKADFAVVSVDMHAYAFAVAPQTATDGTLSLALPGAAATAAHGQIALADLAEQIHAAVQGQASLVVLTLGKGDKAVAVALYRPDAPDVALRSAGATGADVWVGGADHHVDLDGTGGLASLRVTGGDDQGKGLLQAVADMRAQADLGAAKGTGEAAGSDVGSESGSESAASGGSIATGVNLGAGGGDGDADVDLNTQVGGSSGGDGN
jgi:hypothetical protein